FTGKDTLRCLALALKMMPKGHQSISLHGEKDLTFIGDLWKVCKDYGTVVDVFIPNKKSKAGKRFVFGRFIKVLNFDRLIENFKTIWIGRFHLSANPARFDRPKAPTFQKDKPVSSGNVTGFRQPNVQYHGGSNVTILTPPFLLKPTLVLNDSCLVNKDLVNCVMGEVLQFSSINYLQVLLSNEGFHNARIVYLGGLWIASKWGEMVELEDGYDDLFAKKQICIKTSQTENILESFKIIVKGKVFWARAKELFVWSPSFKEVPDKVMCLDDESVKINEEANSLNNGVEENDSEVVLDTYFGDNGEDQGLEHQHVRTTGTTTSIPYPPGFTPVNKNQASIKQDAPKVESDRPPNRSKRSNSRVLEEVAISVDISSSESINNEIKLKEGGSILEILEEMITVGQTMGFSMEGCTKDMEKIIGTQGEQLEGYSFTWAHPSATKMNLKSKLSDIDKMLDQGIVTDDILLSRMEVLKQLHDVQSSNNRDIVQKAKIRWAIEGDENSKYFHVIINKKRANLSVKDIMVDGDWIDDPDLVKHEFRSHFADRFQDPGSRRGSLNFLFPNRLSNDQILDLESSISKDEIRTAVWGCDVDKSLGLDGFTFEFFHKYWAVFGPDFSIAVKWFFEHGDFAIGCNSSFVALIPKVLDPKVVSDYRPISLIGSLYKVITKILATQFSLVISDLISDVQIDFLPNRQILDGPFIINEILARCKLKKQQAMIFKVDFSKAYDSIRWDFLDDVLISFGFGSKWHSWIRGSLSS
nr:RNA-directed DNA polymerase, eukaryota [Tanacetum cinerariifolium]